MAAPSPGNARNSIVKRGRDEGEKEQRGEERKGRREEGKKGRRTKGRREEGKKGGRGGKEITGENL